MTPAEVPAGPDVLKKDAPRPRDQMGPALSNWTVKYDELAFLNQQLAGMLKSGIPLEPALRQLCLSLRRGRFRAEFEALQADLTQGVPLDKALAGRRLPDFYKEMVRVGAKSNNLPAMLTLLADYYQKVHALWTRLKTLLIYPLLVLMFCFGLSLLLIAIAGPLSANFGSALGYPLFGGNQPSPMTFAVGMLMPLFVLGLALAAVFAVLAVPRWRRNARWILPGFKEAHLSRFASALALMLKSGSDLKTALALLRRMEDGTKMGRELARWEDRMAQGAAKFTDLAANSKVVPPLFFWLVAGQGEDLDLGLAQAAQMYYDRAVYRSEVFLQTVLPVSVLGLGVIITVQLTSMIHLLFGGGFWLLRNLSDDLFH
jgi:general secretion pathway protein F